MPQSLVKYLLPFLLVGGLTSAPAVSKKPASPQRPTAPEKSSKGMGDLLAKADFSGMQTALGTPLLAAGAAGLGQADVQAGLARHEFIRACGADALADLAKREGGAALLKALLSDPAWLESLLISDPPNGTLAQTVENLRLLHHYGKDLDQPLYRRLATAMALSAGKLTPYILVERFGQIQRTHREGLMHSSFDALDVREMRWSLYLGGNAADYDYLVNDRQTPLGDYLGACWAVAYRDPNDYGDSIQGPWYHHAFRHALPGWQAVRAVGGVCGSLSTYGSMAARVHGIPSTTVGQPGHCAYVVRVGESWPIGNSVTWPTSTAAPGWEGTGYATLQCLYEQVQRDRPRFLTANRAAWLARLQLARGSQCTEWSPTFEQAIVAQPLNYTVWLEYAKAMAADKNVTPAERLSLARRAAQNFSGYPEAAWGLIHRLADKVLTTLPMDDRLTFLLECHHELTEEKATPYVHWPFDGMLNWQAAQFGGQKEKELEYFTKLLQAHNSKPPHHHVFSGVLAWGQARYASDRKTAALFAQAMGTFFKSPDAGADDSTMRNQIAGGLRAAATADDPVTFRQWAEMNESLLPPITLGDVFLNAKQVADFPKPALFSGELLSTKALLKTSSASQYDRPLSYPALLRAGGFGGFLDTNGEDNPYAIVQLPGSGELSGIIIVDRYEFPSEFSWSVPLRVSISTDGKAWTALATWDNPQPSYRLDLGATQPKARFVKVERLSGKKDRFHLRSILVFGKPLY